MIESIIDNDLYKFTMQYAVMQKYPWAEVEYKFYNRDNRQFPKGFDIELGVQVNKMRHLELLPMEAQFLKKTCGKFLSPAYLDFLSGYRYKPSEVSIEQEGGDLRVTVRGPWYRTILWEVPLMAMISELYFNRIGSGYKESNVEEKIEKLRGIKFADFGTRRRFSSEEHYRVVEKLKLSDDFVGTSNVWLAMKHDLKPMGTQAHEWFMFHGAKYGYRFANKLALRKWFEVYHGHLGIALTDTYTTDAFIRAFDVHLAKLYDGVRHDSGSPTLFAAMMIRCYEKLGIDPSTKTIVFSDGLTPDHIRSIEHSVAYATRKIGLGIKTSYGIGTNLTNDVGVNPLNIVIKLDKVNDRNDDWTSAIKLSDAEGKHTGDPNEIELCKRELGLE